ncbi:3-oxoacid CoA-transferase subunit B [Anaerospora hongkongensis]|uniref:3-oxoacid CoA-transferase subunit B n=1 Tax=Anaerospora hongkongensis TaxID=244830 RepID=UPI00289E96DC|nr:3-oxoacid CoA-transferase subunit B [Anaerospora hongkongensis]
MDFRELIARRAALELKDGEVVNLGFGMPMAVANFIPKEVEVILQSENGCLVFGPTPRLGEQDADTANSGSMPITLKPGASLFDIFTSFGIIRGGHVDTAILGALEVDQNGSIANWSMPGRSPGMGGAMDLVAGARKIVAILQHNDKKGESKILKECSLPLTGKAAVDVIITEKAVFHVTSEGLVLKEIIPGLTTDDIRAVTQADFTVSADICEYQVSF